MNMEDTQVDELKIIEGFIPKENKQDSLLCTASVTLIVGIIAFVSSDSILNYTVVAFLLISIVCLTLSALLLSWYNPRLSLRNEKWRTFLEGRVEKAKDDAKKFARLYSGPLFKEKMARKIEKYTLGLKDSKKEDYNLIVDRASKESALEIDEDQEERVEFFAEFMYKSFMTDLYFVEGKMFRKPLDESWAKSKFYIDIIAWRARYHFFTVGFLCLILAVTFYLILPNS